MRISWGMAGLTLLAGRLIAQEPPKDELEQLKKRVEALEKKSEPPAMIVEYKDGLKLRTPDGKFQASVGGRVYTHYRTVFDRPEGTGGPASDGFFLRAARLNVGGTILKELEYFVEVNAPTPGPANLTDAYLGWKGLHEFQVKIGQFKVPFSQEETCSSRFIDFVERSLVNRLAPGRDLGAMLHGELFDGIFAYQAMVYNGSGINAADTNDEKDFAGRLHVSPFLTSAIDALKKLRLGIAGVIGDQDALAFGDVSTTESGTRFLDIDNTNVGGGDPDFLQVDGDRVRYGLEFSWAYGGWGVRAEWVKATFDMMFDPQGAPPAVTDTVEITAWYAAITFLLTGEEKNHESPVKPLHPFHPAGGDWGAIELAFRVHALEIDDRAVAGGSLVDPATDSTSANDGAVGYTVGVNWYLTSNYRVMVNYFAYRFAEDLVVGSHSFSNEQGLLMRFQVYY